MLKALIVTLLVGDDFDALRRFSERVLTPFVDRFILGHGENKPSQSEKAVTVEVETEDGSDMEMSDTEDEGSDMDISDEDV